MNSLLWLTSCESSRGTRTRRFKACIAHFIKIIEVFLKVVSLSEDFVSYLACFFSCCGSFVFSTTCPISLSLRCMISTSTCEPFGSLLKPVLKALRQWLVTNGSDMNFVSGHGRDGPAGGAWHSHWGRALEDTSWLAAPGFLMQHTLHFSSSIRDRKYLQVCFHRCRPTPPVRAVSFLVWGAAKMMWWVKRYCVP